MEFMVFREMPVNQCYTWVPYNSGDPLDERMVATESSWCIVARLHVNGNDVVCYYVSTIGGCWGALGVTRYNTKQGYRCERLRVMEGCTIFWVPYTAGKPLPSQAVIGGFLANGNVAYVVKFDAMDIISGYYIEGAPHAISAYRGSARTSLTMMMMVVL